MLFPALRRPALAARATRPSHVGPRRARGPAALTLVALVALLVACGAKELGRAPGVRLLARADGGGELLVEGWPRVPLSPSDVAGRASIELARDEGLDAVAFRAADGQWVNLVALAGEPRRGPLTAAPAPYEVIVGGLLATHETPDALVGAVRGAKGSRGVARVLARAAATEGPTWEKRLPTLWPADRDELRAAFSALLADPTASPALLSRAVTFADPRALSAPELAARLAGLTGASKDARGGLGAAVLLRVLATKSPADAGRLGCQVLSARPPLLAEPEPERAALVDAAVLAVAKGAASCDAVDALLREEPCAAGLRCGPAGPLLANQTTTQDEPVCTAEALTRAVDAELARPPAEVARDPHPGRTSTYALAAHTLGKRAPVAEVERPQARRMYPISQVKSPECEALTEVGRPCHAPEAVLRDQACRSEGAVVRVGTLSFRVDDAKKTLGPAETAAPP